MGDNRHQSLTSRASQDTLASLVQLDPMPIADLSPLQLETDIEPAQVPLNADAAATTEALRGVRTSPAAAASALGLSGTGHGAIYFLTRAQRYSSYAFTIFTSVHLITTSLVPLATQSVPASESYLLLAREIYQTRMSEPALVFIPIVVHVAAGIGLRLVRRSQNLHRYGGSSVGLWPDTSPDRPRESKTSATGKGKAHGRLRSCWHRSRLHAGWPPLSVISASGYAFAVALASHVTVNRLLPLAVEGDSADIGLAYVAHGFARHPVTTWLSYGAFLGLASGHMVWGWARWLRIAQNASWGGSLFGGFETSGSAAVDKVTRKRRRRLWLTVQAGTVIIFAAWACGGLGVVARGGRMQGWVGKMYDGLYEVVWL